MTLFALLTALLRSFASCLLGFAVEKRKRGVICLLFFPNFFVNNHIKEESFYQKPFGVKLRGAFKLEASLVLIVRCSFIHAQQWWKTNVDYGKHIVGLIFMHNTLQMKQQLFL
jgi:hypothetical protein